MDDESNSSSSSDEEWTTTPTPTMAARIMSQTEEEEEDRDDDDDEIPKKKNDTNNDDENELTEREAHLKSLLEQMGFTDETEMLTGIRHCIERENENEESVDSTQVMLWIIKQREEAEESLKMDLARAQSEQLRAASIKRREEERKRRIKQASNLEWKTNLFSESVILEELDSDWITTFRQRFGDLFASFLGLEKKAIQWYGKHTPWCYLQQVASKLDGNCHKQDACRTIITGSIREMERSMYLLSQYEHDVPKLFASARAQAVQAGLPSGPPPTAAHAQVGDDDEDEVQIVDIRPAGFDATSSSSRAAKRMKVEVEIPDDIL